MGLYLNVRTSHGKGVVLVDADNIVDATDNVLIVESDGDPFGIKQIIPD